MKFVKWIQLIFLLFVMVVIEVGGSITYRRVNSCTSTCRGLRGSPGVKGQAGSCLTSTCRTTAESTVLAFRKGDAGSVGPPGYPGSRGIKGEKGASGISGPKGETVEGQRGDSGVPGNIGLPGLPGVPGMIGPKGESSSGAKGDKGDPGLSGIQTCQQSQQCYAQARAAAEEYIKTLNDNITQQQGTASTTGALGFLPETGYMMAVMVTLALQILVIVLTVSIACGMICYFRKKLEKGQSQRESVSSFGTDSTQTIRSGLSAIYDTYRSSGSGPRQAHDYDYPISAHDQRSPSNVSYTRRPIHPQANSGQSPSNTGDYMEMLASQE